MAKFGKTRIFEPNQPKICIIHHLVANYVCPIIRIPSFSVGKLEIRLYQIPHERHVFCIKKPIHIFPSIMDEHYQGMAGSFGL
jgi:hypothetical protein